MKPALEFAQETLGCRKATWSSYCGVHLVDSWPCSKALALAALIEARDREVRDVALEGAAVACLADAAMYYPTDVFPPLTDGDKASVRAAMQARGSDIDRVSADMFRRALAGQAARFVDRAGQARFVDRAATDHD